MQVLRVLSPVGNLKVGIKDTFLSVLDEKTLQEQNIFKVGNVVQMYG